MTSGVDHAPGRTSIANSRSPSPASARKIVSLGEGGVCDVGTNSWTDDQIAAGYAGAMGIRDSWFWMRLVPVKDWFDARSPIRRKGRTEAALRAAGVRVNPWL